MSNYTLTSGLQFYSESNTDAFCEIQIGSVTGKLNFYTHPSNDRQFRKIAIPSNIQTLIDAGMDLDFQPLIESYMVMVQHQAEIVKLQKYTKGLAYYDKCWLAIFRNKIDEAFKGYTYKIEGREEFANRWAESAYSVFPMSVEIHYRDETLSISYERSGAFYVNGRASGYKNRRYKTIEQACKKSIEIINEYANQQEEERQLKLRTADANKQNLDRLNSIFGGAVVSERKWNSRGPGVRGPGGRDCGYYITSYYIAKGDRKLLLEQSHSGMFYFAGLGKLTVDQIHKVLEII